MIKLQFLLKSNLHTQLQTIANFKHSAKICTKKINEHEIKKYKQQSP